MKAFTLLSLFIALQYTYAQDVNNFNKPEYAFIQNIGQVYDQNYIPNPHVKYLLSLPGMNVQLRTNGYSYDTYTISREETQNSTAEQANIFPSSRLNFHRVDITFIGSNPNVILQPLELAKGHYNYYNAPGGENGFLNVRHYNKVVYKELYPDTDLEFVVENGKMKFNFILGPLGDAGKIQWEYSGQNGLSFTQKSPSVKLDAGEIRESIPYSYIDDDNRRIEVKVKYKRLSGSIFGFDIDTNLMLKPGQKLVIDPIPEQLWGTYFGDVLETSINDLHITSDDSIVFAGFTTCVNNIASAGAFKTFLTGPSDAVLNKLNSNGVRLWTTYYGGMNNDGFSSVVSDKSGHIFVAGLTKSPNGIATPSAFQTQHAYTNYNDAVLARFTSGGQRVWCTYYGGLANENVVTIAIDSSQNIYLAGRTLSDTMHMTTPGAHQMANPANQGEAPYQLTFLAKFTPSGTRIWGTYIRGTNHISPVSVKCDPNNFIIIGGDTSSNDSIATPGTWLTIKPNQDCGWIMKFNDNGQRVWGTYFGGTGGGTSPYTICTDNQGMILMAGSTAATIGISSTNAYQASKDPASSGFVSKFNANGQRIWGTYYGGSGSDAFTALTVDSNYNIYTSGHTDSPNNIASSNGMQTVYQGYPNDVFIVKLDSSGQRIWGTYFGGLKEEYSYAIRISKTGKIVVGGRTKSTSGIATTGAFKTIQGSNGTQYTGFITRLSDCTESTKPIITVNADSICHGEAVRLNISGILNDASHWEVYKGNTLIDTTSADSIWIAPGESGYYNVRGAGGCVVLTEADSVHVFVNLPALNAGGTQVICFGQPLFINAQHAPGILNWSNGLQNGDTLYLPHDTLFTVSLTDSMQCSNTDTLRVKVVPLPPVNAGNDTSLCEGSSLVLIASGSALTYIWNDSIANGSTFTADSTLYLVVTGTDSNQCVARDSLLLTTHPLPIVSFQNAFHQMCFHHPAQALSGGLPVGGVYTGMPVMSGMFNPALAISGWNTLSYVFSDSNGCESFAIDSIYVDSCLQVESINDKQGFRLYPNPAGDFVTIELFKYQEDCIFSIYCLSGRLISEISLQGSPCRISVSHLPDGVYLYRISNTKGIPGIGLLIKE